MNVSLEAMRPLFWLSTISQESQQSAPRGRVLAFYRIAPCLKVPKRVSSVSGRKLEPLWESNVPINGFACEGFCKFTVDVGVIYRVWLTTVDAVAVCIYPISETLFLCNDNPMKNLKWSSFDLLSLHVFKAILKTSVQFFVSIEISLSHLSGPVWLVCVCVFFFTKK